MMNLLKALIRDLLTGALTPKEYIYGTPAASPAPHSTPTGNPDDGAIVAPSVLVRRVR
jgi:hypothetical protein